MSENDEVIVHERLTRIEVNLDNTIKTVENLAKVVEKQGVRLTRTIIAVIVILSVGVISNGGSEHFIQTIQNMAKIFG